MVSDWFLDAKLGIFIHWGIYAVDGTVESWPIFNRTMPYDDYMAQRHGFTASNYQPEDWTKLFVEAGAKYAVLTSKHHDGVALWDTKVGELSTVKSCPAQRDLLSPYVQAVRQAGLKVGIYYSHLDWSHPDYASVPAPSETEPNPFAYADVFDETKWNRFLDFHRAQLNELCTQFGRVDLMWFDGDWERSSEVWKMAELRAQLREWQPEMVVNSRMQGHGDYDTPEQGLPLTPPSRLWEFCVTLNNNWGYRPSDIDYKSPEYLRQLFVQTICGGGNMLLDIGPREDGSVPEEQASLLRGLGAWILQNSDAIYGTRRGLPSAYCGYPSTASSDGTKLNFFVPGGVSGFLVRGIKSQIASSKGGDAKRQFSPDWHPVPGDIWVTTPVMESSDLRVVQVEFESQVELYQETK